MNLLRSKEHLPDLCRPPVAKPSPAAKPISKSVHERAASSGGRKDKAVAVEVAEGADVVLRKLIDTHGELAAAEIL